MIAAGRRLAGRYRLERRLGHGGMAAVWLAVDERLDREVAVKVLSDVIAADPEYLARFRREAHTAAALKHPNLVGVWDFGAGDRPFLVMEYVAGGDLAARLDSGDAPPAEDLARDLLGALRHMHAQGVLHRDIKPHNVLIGENGAARLTDFGIAQPAGATALTRTGHVIGTESYIAPEVREGAPASERSDLFALGVVLADVAPEGAGAPVRDLAERLRDPDPGARPPSASAALASFERALEPPPAGTQTRTLELTESDEPTTQMPASFTPSPTGVSGGSPRRRRALALLAVGAIGVVLAVGLALGSGDEEPPSSSADADASKSQQGSQEAKSPEPDVAPAGETQTADTTTDQEPVTAPADDGIALDQQGKALIDAGRPDEAVPVLEQAVAALEGSGDDLAYNFALFNLANALRLSGQPEEAIPLLELRLEYPDQTEAVQAELDAALADAGLAADSKPGKGPKKVKEPKSGGVPPPFEDDD